MSCPGHRAYCYVELAVSSLMQAITIASTHCASPQRNGLGDLIWVAGYIAIWFTCQKAVTHSTTTNKAYHRTTLLTRTMRCHCAIPPLLSWVNTGMVRVNVICGNINTSDMKLQ